MNKARIIKYFADLLIITTFIFNHVNIPLHQKQKFWCGGIPFSYAGSIKDLKRQLSGYKSKEDKALYLNEYGGVNILEEIYFSPLPSEPSFWSLSLQEFKKLNPQGAWKEERWNETELQLQAGRPHTFIIWQISPVDITARFSNNKLSWIKINLWNKGDSSLDDYRVVSKTYRNMRKTLESAGIEGIVEKQKVSSIVKRKWDTYRIGTTDLSLSFERKEYFIVKLSPANNKNKNGEDISERKSKIEFREHLKSNVEQETNGDVYICGIPMIEQGKKGYCAPATCTRIMLYYGIEVDMHILADLMHTIKGGTFRREMEYSLRRLCRGNPVSYKMLVSFRPRTIKKYIDKGIPIIWGIPGHIRLIIGYNEKTEEIIYSDSWGRWAKSRRMPYKGAKKITYGLYVLR